MTDSGKGISSWGPRMAPLAVCLYLLTFALPLERDLSLPLLALCGLLAAIYGGPFAGFGARDVWLPLEAYLAVLLLTTTFSIDPPRSLTLSAALVPAVAIYLLLASCRGGVNWVLAAHLLVSLEIFALLGVDSLQRDVFGHPGHANRITALGSPALVVANDLAYLALLTPLAVAFAMRRSGWWRKASAAVVICITLLIAGVAESRLLAGLLVMMLLMMTLLLRPRMTAAVAALLLGALIILDAITGWPLAGRLALLWQPGQADPWGARLPIWQHAWQAFLQHPILGQGPHTFSHTSVDGIQVSWAHNLYLETLAEQGIVGLVALLTLLGALLRRAVRSYRTAAASDRPLAAALLSVLTGIVAGGFIEFTFVRLWLNILLFTIAGLLARDVAETVDD